MLAEQVIPLPLFDESTESKNFRVTEDQIAAPLVNILYKSIPTPTRTILPLGEIPQSINDALEALFPEQEYEEKAIQTAKEILKPIAKEFTPEELKYALFEMQYLIETWMDDFERSIFDGLTLQEMLHEKGKRI